MKLCIIGTGYVGLTTGVCFASLGNHVICVDSDKERIQQLKRGVMPIHEKKLVELAKEAISKERLEFTNHLGSGVEGSDILFISVGTPSLPDGGADLTAVRRAAADIAGYMKAYRIIVVKSTVPVGTQKQVSAIINNNIRHRVDFDVVSNPEFLREGNAVYDTMHPDRIVIGTDNMKAAEKLTELYAPMDSSVLVTDPESAEMIKYASNAFLAVKISFINEIANLCEKVGADVTQVAHGMGLDSRISAKFLKAGLGYGGSCFPKDTLALVKLAEKNDCSLRLVESAIEVNKKQRHRIVEKLTECMGDLDGKTIGILGLAFKPDTDDIRQAPALDIINKIIDLGARIKAYDPAAMSNTKKVIGHIEYCESAYQVAQGADALILVTEWDQFKNMNLERIKGLMKGSVFIDGRNIYDADSMLCLGFDYHCIGRRITKNESMLNHTPITR